MSGGRGGTGTSGTAGSGGGSGDAGGGSDGEGASAGEGGRPGGDAGAAAGGAAGDDSGSGGVAPSGGTAGEGNGGEAGAGSPVDTTPPTIVSVSPSNGERAVVASSNIVVTFSEPMDRTATEAAFSSPDVGSAALSWNGASTVLTINPSSNLEYAQGSNPDTLNARDYEVTIGDNARDEAGNPLVSQYTWSFETLRQVTQTLSHVTMYGSYGAETGTFACASDVITVGYAIPTAGGHYLAYFAFDLSSLSDDITSFVSATLEGQVGATGIDVDYSVDGPMELHHIDLGNSRVWDAPMLHDLGAFSNSATPGARSLSVLPAVIQDYPLRATRLNQYRLFFPEADTSNDSGRMISVKCSNLELEVSYLIE
jgi:hypothetical protein